MPPPRCNICTETFNNGTNFPMILPCGRSMCHACVLRYLENPMQRCFGCAGNHLGITVDRLQKNYELLAVSMPPESVVMSISPSARQSSGTLQIVLKELDGTNYRLHARSTSTILTVKHLIKDEYGFDPAETKLLYSGEVLQDNYTLASYGVKTGNTLQMITNYEGGRVPHTRM